MSLFFEARINALPTSSSISGGVLGVGTGKCRICWAEIISTYQCIEDKCGINFWVVLFVKVVEMFAGTPSCISKSKPFVFGKIVELS